MNYNKLQEASGQDTLKLISNYLYEALQLNCNSTSVPLYNDTLDVFEIELACLSEGLLKEDVEMLPIVQEFINKKYYTVIQYLSSTHIKLYISSFIQGSRIQQIEVEKQIVLSTINRKLKKITYKWLPFKVYKSFEFFIPKYITITTNDILNLENLQSKLQNKDTSVEIIFLLSDCVKGFKGLNTVLIEFSRN